MFFLGYGSNEHAYRVFKKNSRRVEIAVDVTFDESNGSQVEQVDASVVGMQEPTCEAITQLAISDIRPQEEHATEVETSQVAADPKSLTHLMQQCHSHLRQYWVAALPHLPRQ